MPYYHNMIAPYLKLTMEKLGKSFYMPVAELTATAWWTAEPVPFAKKMSGKKLTLKPGEKWGGRFDCAWFNFKGRVPRDAAGKHVVLLLDVNGEGLVMDEKGNPHQGLTTVNSRFLLSLGGPGKRVVQLSYRAKGDEKVDVWVDCGANDLFGHLQGDGTLRECQVAVCHDELRALYYDFVVLHELMTLIPEKKARHQTLLAALNKAANELVDYTDDEAKRARKVLAPELAKKGGDASLKVVAVGHAHIDLAWLWPIRETIRKGARTFATVLRMMEKYPDYIYGQSQPQLYEWMKIHYPGLYAQIKKAYAAGRWEPQGCMWVEADTNMPGGEALVRQVLYGKRFFRQEFNMDVRNLWLPDCFGFSGAIPQILKKSGCDYFMTQKLCWNWFNRFPHHTFKWQGIDGSEVLAHMLPEDNYNSPALPRSIIKVEDEFIDSSVSDECMILFGIGDGGGGPGAEHLEALQREKDLNGLAPVSQDWAANFFERINKNRDDYATWRGELYFERHQGCFTTHARNKWYNRKLEYALHDLELSAALAEVCASAIYPKDELDAIWKEFLLYQFHDILPGSSIKRVYDESLERYADMARKIENLRDKADAALLATADTKGLEEPLAVINSLSWEREEWLRVDETWLKVTVPPMGVAVVEGDQELGRGVSEALTAKPQLLENEYLRVTLGKDGTIISILDKENNREVLAPGGRGNVLDVYEEWGDAWDIPVNYVEKKLSSFKLLSAEGFIDGPRAVVHQKMQWGGSTLTQEIMLTAGSRRMDFVTEVDWRESGKMLRASFPVDILADEATCDIQFGSIRRPAVRNTSWDIARFEIPAHKFVDLSQPDYGVALMSDCKYGYRTEFNLLDIDLLRSPHHPDKEADRTEHQFTYSLYPHAGDHIAGGVLREGYALNVPLRAVALKPGKKGLMPASMSYMQVNSTAVVIEAVKRAEDNDDLIVRLYEANGTCAKTRVSFDLPVKSVALVNLMEEEPKKLKLEKQGVNVDFKPFEIQTLRLAF